MLCKNCFKGTHSSQPVREHLFKDGRQGFEANSVMDYPGRSEANVPKAKTGQYKIS
jgi:hypothetical protein